jgi:hypothetical protein
VLDTLPQWLLHPRMVVANFVGDATCMSDAFAYNLSLVGHSNPNFTGTSRSASLAIPTIYCRSTFFK